MTQKHKQTSNDQINLMDLARRLVRYWWLFLIAIVIGGVGAGAYTSYMVQPEYRAECMIYVTNGFTDADSATVSMQDLNASQSLTETYMVILESRKVLMEVIEKANLPYSYDKLKSMVSASNVNETEVFSVYVTSPDAQEAELIANTIADILPGVIMEIMEGYSVKIVDYAVVPSHQISPDLKKNVITGAGALLVIVLILASLRILLDTTLQTDRDLTEITTLPLLSKVPEQTTAFDKKYGYSKYSKSSKHQSASPAESAYLHDHIGSNLPFSVLEAYRLLRTNLIYSIADVGRGKIIGITSSVASEYKTTSAINLAIAMASEQDKRVLLLDCDLRMSEIRDRLKLPGEEGLTDYLVKDLDLMSLIQHSSVAPNLSVIVGGRPTPNPGDILCSPKMKACFPMLAEQFDYIIVDFPPANIVSDALELGKCCDGVLVVVRQNYTQRAALIESLSKLKFLDINTLGILYTGVIPAQRYQKKYSYNEYYERTTTT